MTWQSLINFAEAQGVKADDEIGEILLNEKDTPETLRLYRDSENRVEIF